MSKEEMIQAATDAMWTLYYEDVEFFYKFVTGYAGKKEVTA